MLKLAFGLTDAAALTEIDFLQSCWSYEHSVRSLAPHWAHCGFSPSLGKLASA